MFLFQGDRISTKCNSGPLSSNYERYLRSINVVPEAYHGVSLTGVRAGYLVKADDSQFWKENFYNNGCVHVAGLIVQLQL